MNIQFDIDISDEDATKLLKMFGGDGADLPAKLSGHAKAALTEYLECYLGRRAYTRGTDILEHRLSLLVRLAFGDKIPTAAQVSDLFQTTLSTSRTLIRNTFSKYRFELDQVATDAAKAALENAEWADATTCNVRITAPNLVEILNRRLLAADPGYKEIIRTQGAIGTYAIVSDAYQELCNLFGATAVAIPQ